MLNMALLAPMPRARVNTISSEVAGRFSVLRQAKPMCWSRSFMWRRSRVLDWCLCCVWIRPWVLDPAVKPRDDIFVRTARHLSRFLNQLPIRQLDLARRPLRVARVVGHHADGLALGVQFVEQIHDGRAIEGVEIARRF